MFSNLTQSSSQSHSKLITHLSLIILLITITFWVLNLIFISNVPTSIFVGFTAIGLIMFGLNKAGYHRIAIFSGLISINLALYAVASSESTTTGIHMFIGIAAFAALVIFGYKEWYIGISFMLFSLILYFAVFLSDYSPLPERNFTQTEIDVFFIVNTLSYVGVCSYLFFLVLRTSHRNEKKLITSKEKISLQNEQLRKTNTELDRFVYSASHDLRAPLSSLSGLITISEMSNNTQELKEYLAMMKSRIVVLDKFILDIINYSRNSRLDVIQKKINLHDLVKDIVDGLKFSIGTDVITIQNLIAPDSEIITDSTRIRIVLNNIVSNAIRYHDKHKENCSIVIEEKRMNKEILIQVKDNGVGIPDAYKDKIFNMFYKANENSSGSGLGLYIAQESIHKLGGHIAMQSQHGIGSTFSITLPITDVDKNS